jgi:Predicted membrane protein
MGQEAEPEQQEREAQLVRELASLSERVEALEREVAQLRRGAPQKKWTAENPSPPLVSAAKGDRAPRRASLENRIGSQLFSRVGIVALLFGAAWFLKLAMDNHWIGPRGRVVAGLVAGAGLIVWSERFRSQGFKAFSWSLKAIGSGVLYLSLWAAFQLYHLLPESVALGAMVLVSAWNAFMAWSQDSEVLAVYALAGGMATPLLLSTGGNHEVFLFTYILAIDIAMILLIRLKPWPRLLLGTFPATVAYFIGWYVAFNSSAHLAPTVLFVSLFFVVFASVPIGWKEGEQFASLSKQGAFRITEIFLPLANASFASLALYVLLQDAGHHSVLPWVMVLFAVAYLGLLRLPQTRIASAVHLSLAVVFLTIAIPLKASGRWITVGWFAEALALLWVSARMEMATEDAASVSAHRILRSLAMAALVLGFCGLMVQPLWFGKPVQVAFLNGRFATALFGIAVLACSAWISLHAGHSDEASPHWRRIAGASIIALNLVAIVACVRELNTVWGETAIHSDAELQKALAVSTFLMIYGAVLLAVGFWKRTAFIRWQGLVLIVFTIAKTFLYDMRNLSQGYRVVSFLGLGALLMAVSFAYQKDWLALRDSEPSSKGVE